MLAGATEEMEDLQEEVGESADSWPLAAVPLHPWQATSVLDYYMVDMPHDSQGTEDDPDYRSRDESPPR